MRKFKATKYDKNIIELENSKEIEELYKTVTDGDNFILEWREGSVNYSKLIIASDMVSKIKTGDIGLVSKRGE